MVAGVEPRITASANPTVARRHGLTKWDRARGQYVAPDPVQDLTGTDADPESYVDTDATFGDADTYDSQTVAELKTELDKRKAEYEKVGDADGVEAVSYGNRDVKADLIVLLREDDEATSGSAEED